MSEDGLLLATVSAVWLALAALYALVPAFNMPGSAIVWGAGAGLFLGLAVLVLWAERQGSGRPNRVPRP